MIFKKLTYCQLSCNYSKFDLILHDFIKFDSSLHHFIKFDIILPNFPNILILFHVSLENLLLFVIVSKIRSFFCNFPDLTQFPHFYRIRSNFSQYK